MHRTLYLSAAMLSIVFVASAFAPVYVHPSQWSAMPGDATSTPHPLLTNTQIETFMQVALAGRGVSDASILVLHSDNLHVLAVEIDGAGQDWFSDQILAQMTMIQQQVAANELVWSRFQDLFIIIRHSPTHTAYVTMPIDKTVAWYRGQISEEAYFESWRIDADNSPSHPTASSIPPPTMGAEPLEPTTECDSTENDYSDWDPDWRPVGEPVCRTPTP